MLDQYVQQLKSADATKRREAIINIGRLGDPRALPHLAQVYKTEADPAIRELIAKAGRHLQKLQAKQKSQAAPPPVSASAANEAEPRRAVPDILAAYTSPTSTPRAQDDLDDLLNSLPPEPEPPRAAPADPASRLPSILSGYTKPFIADADTAEVLPAPSPTAPPSTRMAQRAAPPEIDISKAKPITPKQIEKARSALKAAFDYKTRGDDRNALVELAKAVNLNPALRTDSSALGLASSLVGGSGKEALALVLQRAAETPLKHTGPKYDAEIWDVVLSLLLLFIVVVLFSVAFFYGLRVLTTALLATRFGGGRASVTELRAIISENALAQILPDILRLAFVTMASTFFQTIVIYATGVGMGGAGSFFKFTKAMIGVQIVIYILFAAAFGVGLFGVFSGSIQTFESTSILALILLGVATFGGLGAQSYFAGRAHEMAWWKGFLSVILGTVTAGFIANLLGLFTIND